MVTTKPRFRLLLRAEVSHGDANIIAHTVEISDSLVSVQTDEPALIGDRVRVQFSFPGLVEPFALQAQVIAQKRARGPGFPGRWTLGFMFYTDSEQKRLHALLERIQPPQPEAVGVDDAARRYRVLLVEDNLMTRDAFSHVVQRLFGEERARVLVDIAANGQAAWEMLHGTQYDLAIVDYYLPLLGGDRLIARIRREPSLAHLPVFAISVGGEQARIATLSAGADLFLPKPVVLRDLFSTLGHLTSTVGAGEAAGVGARPRA